MSDKDSPQNVIESYRKRQQSAKRTPIYFVLAALALIIVGGSFIYLGISDNSPVRGWFATETPTPTATATVTPTPTSTSTPTVTPTELPTATITLTPTASGPFIYEVLEGDSCYVIAVKFKVDLLVLITINNLDPSCPIRIGDKLTIPGPDTQLPTGTPIPDNLRPGTKIEYRVEVGDTLGTIAFKFNTTVEAIKEENNIENENDILVGAVLIIPVNLVTPVPTATLTPTIGAQTPTSTRAP